MAAANASISAKIQFIFFELGSKRSTHLRCRLRFYLWHHAHLASKSKPTLPASVPLGEYEIRPDPQALTGSSNPEENASTGVNYEPDPSKSLKVSSDRDNTIKKITSMYSGSANEDDMMVYAERAVYDDPWSFCDTRFKIAGQWYGTLAIPGLPLQGKTRDPVWLCR